MYDWGQHPVGVYTSAPYRIDENERVGAMGRLVFYAYRRAPWTCSGRPQNR
jgi:hypothetical protein